MIDTHLRLSDELNARVAAAAEAQHRSLNAQIVALLEQALDVGKVTKPKRAATAPRGARIPSDFKVTPAMVAWAREKCPEVDGRTETERFVDHWTASALPTAVKRDWVAAWRTWMRKARKDYGAGPGARPRYGYRQAETDALFDDALMQAREHDRKAIGQ